MAYSNQERISHVARQLGFGVEPGILAAVTSIDDTITAALDLSTETPEPTDLVTPADADDARSPEQRQAPCKYWFTQMTTGPRRIERKADLVLARPLRNVHPLGERALSHVRPAHDSAQACNGQLL
jgi:hypothetical protein